jgi:hypothetical protein
MARSSTAPAANSISQSRNARRAAVAGRSRSTPARVARVVAPVLSEERLLTRVVLLGEEAVLARRADRDAGERARGLLHVRLSVVADAEREELHQLARKVLVRMLAAIGLRVEPHEQRRLAQAAPQQLAERCARQFAEGLVLPPHRAHVLDLRLAGREVVVPHEHETLAERIGVASMR